MEVEEFFLVSFFHESFYKCGNKDNPWKSDVVHVVFFISNGHYHNWIFSEQDVLQIDPWINDNPFKQLFLP